MSFVIGVFFVKADKEEQLILVLVGLVSILTLLKNL